MIRKTLSLGFAIVCLAAAAQTDAGAAPTKGPGTHGDTPIFPFPPAAPEPVSCNTTSDCDVLDTDPNDCRIYECARTGGAYPDYEYGCVQRVQSNCTPPVPVGNGCKDDSQCAYLDTDAGDCSAAQCVISTTPGVSNHCALAPIDGCGSSPNPTPDPAVPAETSVDKLACEVTCVSEDCEIALDTEGNGVQWQVSYTAPSSLGAIAYAELTQTSGPELVVKEASTASASTLTTERVLTRKSITDVRNMPDFIVATPKPKSMRGEFLPKFSVQVSLKSLSGQTLGQAECKNQTALEVTGGGCSLIRR